MAKPSICAHPGCRKPAHAKGYCQKHYDKVRRASRGGASRKSEKTCRVPGCSGGYHARGYCQKHYDLFRKRAGMRSEKDVPSASGTEDPKVCRVPGCNRPHHAKGFCKSHYSRLRRRGGIPLEEDKPADICQIDGCSRPAVAHGRCVRHLGRPVAKQAKRMPKSDRLRLIKQRHEIIKREIAMINKALEDED